MGFFGKKKVYQQYPSGQRSKRASGNASISSGIKRTPLLDGTSVFQFQGQNDLDLHRKVRSEYESYNRANETQTNAEDRNDRQTWGRYSESPGPNAFNDTPIKQDFGLSNIQNINGENNAENNYNLSGEGHANANNYNNAAFMGPNQIPTPEDDYNIEEGYNATNVETNVEANAETNAEESADNILHATSDDVARAAMHGGALPNPQSIVVAQLIQWKFAAEQGSIGLRIPAVILSVGLMGTTVVSFVAFINEGSDLFEILSPSHLICGFHTFVMAILICIIDGRTRYARDPLGCRAMLRNVVTRHLNVLKLVWGRGLLYGVAGTLSIALETYYAYISGGLMVALGIIAFYVGSRASKQLRTLRRAMSDEDYLMEEFMRHDSDKDGMLNRTDFAQFILDLGLDFDDLYTLKAFSTIDLDNDQRVEFRDFARWWSQIRMDEIKNLN
mmetsp:Transcript_20536/g.30868  ORF Transcript_20536/g.30868 Transcript_20536/m.30868 type:complete len:445 (+) Transcript_20536:64-1398(+)|eukprot:CAMPEP_0178925900 /NCGR_PEP_ID=MMETSP0786-20121207/18193_1 /TAXON_ID=186022 /ORGANISM="Thalassionema frauenfeldii, Strain CCMP 1798" /LENGTH=444 /DNA_ID=CAMNT_0020600881 /DNA_START=38 /DNA_END=1372 /DNA_ORIENTATION=-